MLAGKQQSHWVSDLMADNSNSSCKNDCSSLEFGVRTYYEVLNSTAHTNYFSSSIFLSPEITFTAAIEGDNFQVKTMMLNLARHGIAVPCQNVDVSYVYNNL